MKSKKISEMHEIKNKKRLRPVRDKKHGGVRLRRISRTKAKVITSVVLGSVVVGGSWLGVAMLQVASPIDVDPGFVTVCYDLPDDGSLPSEHSAIENIGYMNAQFLSQEKWYSEMHGTVDAGIMSQSVETYKQFSDKVLIQADITRSGLVNDAKQFCFVGDDVLIRTAAGSASSWSGLDTEWKTTTPIHISLDSFIPVYGLPGTAFSVYVIREETLLNADPVEDLGNGTYSQTFYLDYALDKAPAHYANSMIEKAHLSALPSFTHITVTYVFDSSWKVLSSLVEEGYYVTKGVSVKCNAQYYTEYEYNTSKAESTDYEDFYKQFASKPPEDLVLDSELSAVDCLSEAFGSMLEEPTSLSLSLSLNGQPFDGIVYLDVANMDIRAEFYDGKIKFWYDSSEDGDVVYLSVGGLNVKVGVDAIAEMFGGILALDSENDGENGAFDLNAILEDLGQGIFTLNEANTFAELATTLHLFGLSIPVGFSFDIDDGQVLLRNVEAEIALGEFVIGADMSFCNSDIPVLTDAEKEEFVEILPYIGFISDLLSADALNFDISYTYGDIALFGSVGLSWKDEIAVSGSFALTMNGETTQISFAYLDNTVYIATGDIRVSVKLNELNIVDVAELIGSIFAGDDTVLPAGFDVSAVFKTILSDEFLSGLTATEENGILNLSIKIGILFDLLGLPFGEDFTLNKVSLTVSDGMFGVSVDGSMNADITVGRAEPFADSVDTEGYADVTDLINLIPYLLDKDSGVKEIVAMIPDILETGAIGFSGTFTIVYDNYTITLTINDGVISWVNGAKLYLNLVVGVNNVKQQIILKTDFNSVQLAYGNVGVNVGFSEEDLAVLESAFLRLYNQIRDISASVLNKGTPLPEIDRFASLLEWLEGTTPLKDILGGILGDSGEGDGFSVMDFLTALKIVLPETADGNGKIIYDGIQIELGGKLTIKADSVIPAMPEIDYLTMDHFALMLDYVGASLNTLSSTDITVTIGDYIDGENASGSGIYDTASGNKITDIGGKIQYHLGEDVLFKVYEDDKYVEVSTSLYLSLSLCVITQEAGSDLYLDLLVFDYGYDGELDFFVTLSMYDSANPLYDPLKIYAPASEIMSVLSAGLSFLGLDIDFINNWIIYQWFDIKTSDQLMAVGNSLKQTMGIDSFLGALSFGGNTDGDGKSGSTNVISEAFLSKLWVDDNEFVLSLNSAAIYGNSDLGDITVIVGRTEVADEESSSYYIDSIRILNIYNSDASEVTNINVGISYDTVSPITNVTLDGYFDVRSIGSLLKVLANTITHDEYDGEIISGEETPHKYVLNKNFYIQGSVSMNISVLSLINVSANVDLVAISVSLDEYGKVGINIRLKYDGVGALGQVAIKGTSQVDITIKDNMVYMKHVQMGENDGWSNKSYNEQDYITTYRVMPLNVFFSDIVSQLGFVLNFGDLILGYLPSDRDVEDESEAISIDYGTMLSAYLSEFKVAGNFDTGYTWTVVLNGSGLTGNVLKDIIITLNTEGTGDDMILRSIGVDTGISIDGVSDKTVNITMTAKELRLCNPQGVMDAGVIDVTNDISTELNSALDKALQYAESIGWQELVVNADGTEKYQYIYVEGVLTNIKYLVRGEVVGSQDVMYDGTTGNLYAAFVYPDVSAYEVKGYHLSWVVPEDGKVPENGMIHAEYVPNEYRVTLFSNLPLAGFGESDEAYEYGNTVYGYSINVIYVYGVGFYLSDGAWDYELDANGNKREFVFADAKNEEFYIARFTDLAGNIYDAGDPNGFLQITTDLVLFTDLDKNVYTVTYKTENAEFDQMAHFGDAYLTEFNYLRDGYVFTGWVDESGDLYDIATNTVTGDKILTARYTPITYTITLTSRYEIEGFVEQNGEWVKTITYVYDGMPVEFPAQIENENSHLNGFAYEGEDKTYTFASVELIKDTSLFEFTLHAVWIVDGCKVTFTAEDENGNVYSADKSYEKGSLITDVPNIGELYNRVGYTGEWYVVDGDNLVRLDTENYVVMQSVTVKAVYTPNIYTITVYSEFGMESAGFTAKEGEYYVRTYTYTYDGGAIALPSAADMKVYGFDFDGYYTKPTGGDFVERIDNSIINNLVIYARQIDNTVTVNLYSDLALDGWLHYTAYNAYGLQGVIFNEVYDLDDAPKTSGYQQLGWWTYLAESDEWVRVTNVRDYNGADIYAMWIKDLTVTVTNFSKSSSTYTIEGTVEGGEVLSGNSSKIYNSLSMTVDTTGIYYIVGSRPSQYDTLKFGSEIDLSSGTFSNKNMMSAYALTWGGASYGGLYLTKKFTYNGNLSVTTQSGSIVSLGVYKLRVVDEEGAEQYSKEFRVGLPFDIGVDGFDYGKLTSFTYLDNLVVASSNPSFFGWKTEDGSIYKTKDEMHFTLTDNVSLTELSSRRITLITDIELDGFALNADGQYQMTVYSYAGATVSGVLDGMPLFNYTVSEDGATYYLVHGEEEAQWVRWEYDMHYNLNFFAELPERARVEYKSAVNFILNGVTYAVSDGYATAYGSYDIDGTYTLAIPTANGYTFLGWYLRLDDGSWQAVESISVESFGEYVTVEALWLQDVTVTFLSASKSGVFSKTYSGSISISGGSLVGAFVGGDGMQIDCSTRVFYYANNDANLTGQSNAGPDTTYNSLYNTDSETYSFSISNKDYLLVEVTVTYSITVGSQTYTVSTVGYAVSNKL